MLYIHQHTCISPQQTFVQADLETLCLSAANKLQALEPDYAGIPSGVLRRMGKAVRMGAGAALPILTQHAGIDAIIIGTANGGMEDCIKFLNQIIHYEEGLLTPGNFVQSTPNAVAAQLGFIQKNKNYNITHVHRGLAFENAVIDAMMLVKENPNAQCLLGAVDEISAYNFNIDFLDGWYKKEDISNTTLYTSASAGSIAGEGAAMFLVNSNPENATAAIKGLQVIHTADPGAVKTLLQQFIAENITTDEKIDTLLTGENGDARMLQYYTAAESLFGEQTAIIRYKHMTGEFPTASALAVWIACATHPYFPAHSIKKPALHQSSKNILIYNNYKGIQHAFILLQKA